MTTGKILANLFTSEYFDVTDGVTFISDLIYLVGGMNDAGKEVKSVDSYNPVTHEWNSLADMHIKRAYVSIGVIDSCIYVAGGWNDTGGALATVEKYSIENVMF